MEKYDFSGWATRNDLLCADGRTIRRNAFKHNDGQTVPLVWNHGHNDPDNILGHALLENRDEGVYAYCTFNESESGLAAKEAVRHGDVKSLSIYANKLKQSGGDVLHGMIREVSIVMSGANPGAFIDSVMVHGEDTEEGIIANWDENIMIHHYEDSDVSFGHAEKRESESNEETIKDVFDTLTDKQKTVVYALIGQALEDANGSGSDDGDDADDEDEDTVEHADSDEETVKDVFDTLTDKQKTVVYALIGQALEDAGVSDDDEDVKHSDEESNEGDNENMATNNNEKTVKDVFDTLTEEQKTVVYALIGQALEDAGVSDDDDDEGEAKHYEGGDYFMHHNVFDNEFEQDTTILSHSDQRAIIEKAQAVGSFKRALNEWGEEHLQHGFDTTGDDAIGLLFPDYKDVKPGAPELLERDYDWVANVMAKARKNPASRVRTRQVDARAKEIRAKGYTDRESEKTISANVKLLMRNTDPQTVYYRDSIHRDDVIDMDFDVIAYQNGIMERGLKEEVALAALVGDRREDTDPDKISEDHIRPIWHDADLYTIKAVVDLEAMTTKLQGTNTGANFGEEYIFTESVIAAALHAREQYKGKGVPDFYCTPHTLNTMLLARDLNGRRIYESKADIVKALNVGDIFTVEQFADLPAREDTKGGKFNLLGLFVNMGNYMFGSTKGGEITSFDDFDMDFNTYKFLLETRLSGALTEVYSAIALEQPVTEEDADDETVSG